MRQQHYQAAGLSPFRFAAGDELVNHHLRAVGEIAELRLPQHQRQRVGQAVAELKPEHREFAERAVVDIEARLVGRNVLQRDIVLAHLGIVKGQVALAESAAAGILAAQPDGSSLQRQRAERQCFAECPIDGAILLNRLAPLIDEAAQLGVQVERIGEGGDGANHSLDYGMVHRSARAYIADIFAGDGAQLLHVIPLGGGLRCVICVGKALGLGLPHRLHFV